MIHQLLTLIDLENTKSSIAQTQTLKFNLRSIKVGNQELMDTKLTLNQDKVNLYLKKIASQIDRPVQEPLLSVDPSSDPQRPKITQFQPPIEGQKLDLEKTYTLLSQAMLNQNQKTIELPVTVVKPKNKLTNDLGINELIGRGVSNFAGSIPNRIYNIELTAQRINGALIPPGEIFSFNSTIGDVSADNGYKQAYVIKSGRTVLDDGGGVCQDSTTVFRAALNAGLPIVKRTAHAYRVGYYEQGFPPGLDATIFTPSVDFQFKNDTPAHILLQAYTRGTTLYIDLYGTSDGRFVEMTKPIVLNQTPPPDPLYQDDPSLPRGTTKQVDFSAWGANVSFSRTVTRNGEVIISDTFKSNYRPWQAVYLVGTAQ
ncbi:MAG: VanW family protein [Candidatus Daviesbacteria bacterium GW2011_GWA1_36_8]|uniref:VanW family protein n=1 Tax=Candidatus Daviesbacteria bacterium GW2011_GWA1_36_8 TaxID=1618417 RepID=A0A0G0FDB2_9BACT|nr:MAG: VanW family protein [Candidatus Daviesbacteria bacterium GW2011_GWA1_36_8]